MLFEMNVSNVGWAYRQGALFGKGLIIEGLRYY